MKLFKLLTAFYLTFCSFTQASLAHDEAQQPSLGTLINEERWEEALPILEERIEARTENFYGQYLLGRARYHNGLYQDAKAPLLIAAGYSQRPAYASAYLARTYARLGDGGLAMQWLTRTRKFGLVEYRELMVDEAFAGIKNDPAFEAIFDDWDTNLRFQYPVNHPDYVSPWHPLSAGTTVRTDPAIIPNWTGGMTLGPDGTLYIGTFGPELYVMDRDSNLSLFADGFKETAGVALGPDGKIYLADFGDGKIYRFSRDGSEREIFADQNLFGPVGIAFDSKGNLFAANCDGGSIAKITPDGKSEIFARSTMFYCTNGVMVNERDELIVVNYHDGIVSKILPDGSVHFIAESPSRNNSYSVYANGLIFVTANKEGRIYVMDEQGRFRILAGTGQIGSLDGFAYEASFNNPNAIVYDPETNELIVNDQYAGPALDPANPVATTARIRRIKLPD